jgi:regulatory protein
MMQIQRIDHPGKHRHVVYFTLNGEELTMPLYGGELHRYHIKEDAELSDEVYCEIRDQILKKRALTRSEYLLGKKNYTARELSQKLEEGYYPEEVVSHVLRLLTDYGFINDLHYAQRYVELQGTRKSSRQMRLELTRKGIDAGVLEQVFLEAGDTETAALQKLVEKRCKNADLTDPKEWNKQLRYLLGKGFAYEQVKEILGAFRKP